MLSELSQAELQNLLKRSVHNCSLTKGKLKTPPVSRTKSSCIGLKENKFYWYVVFLLTLQKLIVLL